MPPGAASSSSADPVEVTAGTVIGGFRVERRLGGGSLGTVYEATQLTLGRPVALRLIPRGALMGRDAAGRFEREQRLAAAVHHPGLVPTYEAGEWDGGPFTACRLVRGRTLAEVLAGRPPPHEELEAMLDRVGGALDAVHAAGLAHGRVDAGHVLVDDAGDAHLAGLGLGRPGTPAGDRAALAALRAEARGAAARHDRRSPRRPAAALVAVAVAVAIVIALTRGGEGESTEAPPPALAPGVLAVGSNLGPGPATPLGCSESPDSNTPPCTIGPASIAGRDGVIRSWAVRGASGELSLQVVGHAGGRVFLRSFSAVERIPDDGPHRFATGIPVRRGDRISVLLAPGATVGSRPGAAGTAAFRWEGTAPYAPTRQGADRLEREVLLRADVEPGARPELPQTTGERAARAPAGEQIGRQAVDPGTPRAPRVVLVRVGGGIAIDSRRAGRRRARLEMPDLDPGGHPTAFEGFCGIRHGFCLRWLNPGDDAPVVHAYRLGATGAFRLVG
jgi:hypothetical protein